LGRGLDIRFQLRDGVNLVFVNGGDVSPDIRTAEISDGASRVSALPEVRAALLDLQRLLGAGGGVVVEGRDIGTVVFPGAEAKFYLTATVEERARRRAAELRAQGRSTDDRAVLLDIVARDLRDTTRAVAPLRPADDAVEIDSSGMTALDVVDQMASLVHRKLLGAAEPDGIPTTPAQTPDKV
jgi:cytidylate kinase